MNSSFSGNAKNIKQFSEFEPMYNKVNREEYFLGPGDDIYLNIVTSNQVINLNITISPDGNILIPVVGVINLDGLSIEDGFSQIKRKCLDKYNDSDIYVTLSKMRKFKVKVLGPFSEAGFYNVSPIDRVSDIYQQIISRNSDKVAIGTTHNHNLEKHLSKRRILLNRGDEKKQIDLVKYFISGRDSLNPVLINGDVLYFDLKDRFVTIDGGVKFPSNLEYVEGETLSDILYLSGGFTYDSYKDEIEVSRYTENNQKINLIIEQKYFDDFMLMPQDFINIKILNNFKKHSLVEIKGEVLYPGKYSIMEGLETVQNLIDRAGGYTSIADKNKVFINRNIREDSSRNEIYKLEFHDYIDRSYNIKGNNTNKIYSYSKEYTDEIKSYSLMNKDIIEIPKYYSYIELVGSVKNPGIYLYNEKFTIKDYLNKAGGLMNSDLNDVYIIKPHTGNRIKYKDIKKIESGDIVYIVEEIEVNKRTKILDLITITQGVASTLSILLSIAVLHGD
ncbi:MAG: hypothetical protein CMG00_07330 [Candidatus Marinimicrobia bacterium]|nr:hypothetical protein [Candidatus Neomarinimicrobiota bacterium]|tara:strand:+ start:8534 stop:10042 length:1509 start_codon:yes stop_codon:yes gene_type:complete